MPGPNFFRFLNFLILLFSFIVGGISTLSTHIKSTDCFSSIIETGSTSRFWSSPTTPVCPYVSVWIRQQEPTKLLKELSLITAVSSSPKKRRILFYFCFLLSTFTCVTHRAGRFPTTWDALRHPLRRHRQSGNRSNCQHFRFDNLLVGRRPVQLHFHFRSRRKEIHHSHRIFHRGGGRQPIALLSSFIYNCRWQPVRWKKTIDVTQSAIGTAATAGRTGRSTVSTTWF